MQREKDPHADATISKWNIDILNGDNSDVVHSRSTNMNRKMLDHELYQTTMR